jgi:ribokinase
MSGNPVLVVVGSANTDLVVCVPRIPSPGETILGGDFEVVGGGKGANQAVAAARMGADVYFVARVGEDAFGRETEARLQAEGLRLDYSHATPGVASGVALIAVQEGTGENAIVVAPGANARLSPADIDAAAPAFTEAHAVMISLEIPMDAVTRAVETAAERGVPVVLNPAPACPLSSDLLAKISVLTPNETEAKQIFGNADGAVARAVQRGVVGAVIVTRGADGSTLYTRDDVVSLPAFAVSPVDTVAAGDCFTGALAVRLAEGAALPEAVRFASAAAALKVTRQGAQPGIPYRAEVETFLEKSASAA